MSAEADGVILQHEGLKVGCYVLMMRSKAPQASIRRDLFQTGVDDYALHAHATGS